ncbi:MAG TPA: hypothetical protein VEW93_00850 [Acidimicrobiales bacterium]|nr:hypothetical protein [Acidimicrobiales bacterium]
MDRPRCGRVVAALLAAVSSLLLTATPAAATTTTLYVHAGTLDLDIDGDPEYEFVFELGGEDHTCADPEVPPAEFIIDVDGTDTLVEEISLGEDKGGGVHAIYFNLGGNEYQLDRTLGDPAVLGFGSNEGMIAGTHPNQTLTQSFVIEGWISTTSGCEKGTEICHYAVEHTVSGSYDGTTMHMSLNGLGFPAVDFCDSPFSNIGNGVTALTGLTLDDSVPV